MRRLVTGILAGAVLATCLGAVTKVDVSAASGGWVSTFSRARAWMSSLAEERTSQPPAPAPTLQTDRSDYPPYAIVTITGSGWQPLETVSLLLHEDPEQPDHGDLLYSSIADEQGNIINTDFMTDYHDLGIRFILTATGQSSGLTAQTTFADGNPAGNLDQCANGQVSAPDPCDTNAEWVNGNLGASKSHYLEGDSVPYRLRLTNLITGSQTHQVTIEWDTLKGGEHAIDYLTTFDRTELLANPCVGVPGCNYPGGYTAAAIPVDPSVTVGFNGVDDLPAGPTGGDDITQVPGEFRLFGGTITGVSAYTTDLSNADHPTSVTITFTATVPDPVLAWAGHIATRADWGAANSAVNIPGSPYHMRFLDLDGAGGNQDRSLSAEAVIFPATITILKVTDPSPDATGTSFGFTTTGGLSPSTFPLSDGGSQTFTLTSGFGNTYTVVEANPGPAFALSNLVCSVTGLGTATPNVGARTATIVPQEGDTVTCTYTNALQRAHLIVIKHVVNDNGGTAVAADFQMNVSGPTPASGPGQESPGTNFAVDAGTYTVSETGPSGYAASISGDCDSSGTVAITAGQTKTCTITNNDNAPALHLRKVVVNDNGGTAVATDWTLAAAGPTPISGSTPVDSGASFAKGTYTLSESGPANYTASAWACVGGSQAGNQITVGLGESATCTITNDDNGPSLHLRKVVVNDNGGTAVATDWTLSAAGPTPISGSTPVDSGASFAKGTYTLSESGPANYTASAWACVGGSQAGNQITVGLGESATCTITNNDNAPALHLRKVVVNDNGGTAVATDWTLAAAGPTPLSGSTPVDSGASFAKGTYTLSESGPSNYTASAWACVGGSQAGNQITVDLGQTATCTITNNDNAPALHLRKIVVNDNGGTANATDWTLAAAGPTAISGSTPVDSGANFSAGTYSLSESGPSNYTASAWACVGGSQGGNQITVGLGESATCTITNNDNAPALHLRKVVVNDNGGTAVATDWTLAAAGPTPLSGSTPVDSGASFAKGTYTLSESGPSNYTASAWACVGGSQAGNQITVGLGESATCTITNDDNAPALHLRKVVVNDNGGTAVATDWTLAAAGPTPLSGSTPVDSGASFAKGTYTLSESGPANYTASAWACVGGSQAGNQITVGLGESATCTITNDDNAPALHLRKVVVNDNGGTAVATDWTLAAAGPTPLSGSTPVDSGASFSAGTYSLSESGPANYTASAWVCVGGSQAGNQIAVGLGESATCTITNDDNAPALHLRKVVVNDNAGTASASDWTLAAAGPTPISGSTPVDSGSTFSAGSYSLSESGPANYTASAWACVGGTQAGNQITVGLGESATCTITNDDNAPALHLRKVVVNDNGGTAVAADWTLAAAGPTPLSGSTPVDSGLGFAQGTYSLSESGPANYTASAWACVGGSQAGSQITIGLGESATCTITNNDNAPALHLRKIVVNDSGGTASASDWTLSAAGPTPIGGSTPVDSGPSFAKGSYDLAESGPAGYGASAWVCVGGSQAGNQITVDLGQSATCTITNDDIPAQLIVNKLCDPSTDTGKFNLRIDGITRAADASCGGTTGVVFVNAGPHAVSETAGTGTSLADYVSSIGGACAPNGTISLGLGQIATCTVTNVRKGKAQLVKTVSGGPLSGTDTFTFQIREGASGTQAGTVLESGTANAANGGIVNFSTSLVPGATYQFCELVMPGWMTTLGPPFFTVFNPSGDNSVVCTDFTVGPGETKVFTIDNQPPPGGLTRTIGFWKNWASCAKSGGNQKPVLDQTLALAEPGGILIGLLTLHGSTATPDVAPSCQAAVNLLNKSTIDGKKKMASDPAFNMAAQLLAAKLNVAAGAGVNGCAVNAINDAQALLVAIHFNGLTHDAMTAAQTALANSLATTLDQYNNNTLVCGP